MTLTYAPRSLSKTDVFELFAAFLEETGTGYCVVGNTASYPWAIPSDVDVVFTGEQTESQLKRLIETFAQRHGFLLAQVLQHEACAYYSCLFWETDAGWDAIQFDWCTDYVRHGRLIMPRSDFHAKVVAQTYGDEGRHFYVPNAEAGFLYYLAKRLDKEDLTAVNAAYLRGVWDGDPDGARRGFLSVWRDSDIPDLMTVLDDPDSARASAAARALTQRLRQQRPRQPDRVLKDLWRRAKRWLQPSGLVVAVLGPDGVGKSTIIDGIMTQVAPGFRRTRYIHLRPGLGQKANRESKPVTDPHARSPYSLLVSVAKLVYLAADYLAGYLVKIRPAKVRSTLIVFDRYYHDLIVDPRRYRYGGPIWLARFFAHFIPRPDIMLVLNAPAEVIQQRKVEVSMAECQRQVAEYRRLADRHDFAVLVDASQPAEAVVRAANGAILAAMAKRTARRFGRR